jgi:hypothetical protein
MDSQIQPIVDITGVQEKNDMVMDLVAYPNPFTDRVNFKYYLANGGKVEIIINDILGLQVLHYNENSEPGIHTVPINLDKSNTTNVYVYQVLVDGKYCMTGKLVRQ